MAGKVTLNVVEGPIEREPFEFEGYGTFLFGRDKACQACLPGDLHASRHHFIVEVNPPSARIRDLGSANGTWVNGVKYGGRKREETPEEGKKRQYPQVDLKDGDQIKVGRTVLQVHVVPPVLCCQCACTIPEKDREECEWLGGAFICAPCRQKVMASGRKPKAPDPVQCQKCGNDVSKEVGKGMRGDYICESCRERARVDPAREGARVDTAREIFAVLLKLGLIRVEDRAPEIAGYRIEEEPLGVGGMGVVYRATRIRDGERVAIKVMLAQVAVDQDARDRFLREMNIQLQHKRIVSIIEKGAKGSAFYFVMEYCAGGGVDALMKRGQAKLALSEAGPIILQALEGLAHAHGEKVVHRDLKPGNILLTGREGQWNAKVSDWGLAKSFETAGLSGYTKTGTPLGTLGFMAPEQMIDAKYVKPTADIFGMGATLYNMLTGHVPYDFHEHEDQCGVVLEGRMVPIRKRDRTISPRVAAVIDKALAVEPDDRYHTADEMREALARAL